MATYDFPRDLHSAQTRLHQARAEYEELGRTLPWSVEPSEGWTAPKVLYSDGEPRSLPASPGYTDEQKAAVTRLRRELLELSITVSTHPYWATVGKDVLVDRRMGLKHVDDPALGQAGAEAA
ncbi:hypothetical protein AS594_39355 [Streptomyces agglomeratus]|uniref:Uncharacterized protein n=1 Tax=Streptomyces agglomeratus TaxID=285458 RepID=A0A1E5NZ44_9ACTN|nr:hypothetical protein [Streptomyces agglomeratus]OEJ21590.1 hypothetical protein AS594_39355 [Streptomyces agglomeratus]